METNFVPKKTVTIQMDLKLHRMMEEVLQASGLTKTKLLDKLITEAYDDLFPNKCIRRSDESNTNAVRQLS